MTIDRARSIPVDKRLAFAILDLMSKKVNIIPVAEVHTIAARIAAALPMFWAGSYRNPIKVNASGSLIWFHVPGNYGGSVSVAIGLNAGGVPMQGDKSASPDLGTTELLTIAQAAVARAVAA